MKKLSSSTVQLISSGQVISSISSTVKELVENSIDAEADNIEVKLDDFGLQKIEVQDNGKGIPEREIEYAPKAHYTSKITDHSDLMKLTSYGFRGEALHSLCSVSNLSVVTKTKSDSVGKSYVFDHRCEITSTKPSARENGTTIIATNIFKNVPVRKQFYSNKKKSRDELKKIEDLLISYGLILPKLRLVLKHNKSVIWQKSRAVNLKESFLAVFGTHIFNQMKVIEDKNNEMGIDVNAIVPLQESDSDVTGRTINDRTFVYVNRRPVTIKPINHLLKQYYSEGVTNSGNRYPVALLNIDLSPSVIDVNLEPNKTSVILENMEDVMTCLKKIFDVVYNIQPCVDSSDMTSAVEKENCDLPIEAGKADTSQMRKVKSPERDNSQGIVTHDVICDNLDSINHSSSDQDPPLCNGTSKNLEEKISYEGTVLELNKNQSKSLSKNGFEMPVGCLTSTNRADKLAANVDELNKPLCIVDASPPDPKKQCLTPVLGTPMESSSTNAVPHFDSIPNDLHVSKSFSESDKQDNACPLLGPNLVDEMTEQFRENNKENLGIEIPLDDDEELLFGPTTPLQVNRPEIQTSLDKWSKGIAITDKQTEKPIQPVEVLKPPPVPPKMFAVETFAGSGRSPLSLARRKKPKSKETMQKTPKASPPKGQEILKMFDSKRGAQLPNRVLHFDLDKLKSLLTNSKSESTLSGGSHRGMEVSKEQEIMAIGKLKPDHIWLIKNLNQLVLFNTKRAQELLIYNNLVKKHVLPVGRLEKPIRLTESLVGGKENWNTLLNLAFEENSTGFGRFTEDPRITSNGFCVRKREDSETGDAFFDITDITDVIHFYGVSDLSEILDQCSCQQNVANGNISLQNCRPKKVRKYLQEKSEVLAASSSSVLGTEDVTDLLERVRNDNVTDDMEPSLFYQLAELEL